MNKQEFIASRKAVPNLADAIGNNGEWDDYDAIPSGFVYADCCYIENTNDGKFYVIAGNTDTITENLAVAEAWLWDNFAQYEFGGAA